MALSLIDKIDRKARASAAKSFPDLSFWGDSWITKSLARQNVNLNDSKFDFALAYMYVEPVRVCVDLYAQAAAQVPYTLFRGDNEIARSDDNTPKHPLMDMLREHRKSYYTGFFSSALYEMVLYDELVIELIPPTKAYLRLNPLLPSSTVLGLRVLRGAATSLSFIQGKLTTVSYSGDNSASMIKPEHIVYDKGYHPLSDYYGASRMQSVLDETNIVNDLRRWLMRHLKKADRPDVYASPKEGVSDANAWEIVKQALREYMRDENRTMFGGSLPMEWTAIPRPDANNQLDVDDKTRAAIFRGFRVHPALAGDTAGTSYKEEHAAIYGTWIKTELMPLLTQVDEVINDVLIPRAFGDETDLRLEHDTSQFEIVTDDDKAKIEAANMQLQSGGITYKQYYELLGLDLKTLPPQLINAVQVEGLPVPLDKALSIIDWKYQAPAMADVAQAEKDSADADAKPMEVQADYWAQQPAPEPQEEPADDGLASIRKPDGRVKQSEKSLTIFHGDHIHEIAIKAFEPAQATAQDELSAWRKVALKSAGKRDFEPIWLAGDLADTLIDAIRDANGNKAEIASAFEQAHYQLLAQSKAIQATRLDFEYDFESVLRKARDDYNAYGRVQWSSAVRSMIRRYGKQAYIDGLQDGGVIDELSEQDETRIADMVSEQSQYVTNLGREIFKTEDGISDALANQKPEMWYRKSIAPFYHEGRASADGNAMMEFGGSDGLESCTTCTRLKGQRHRYNTWKRKGLIPQVDTDAYECGGFQCEHRLIKVAAKARGSF